VIKLDNDSKSVELMLKHMYCIEDTLTTETVELFVVAHKYLIVYLTEMCKEIILKNLTKENISDLYQISIDYEWEELKYNFV
jgi:predicted thioesterase